MDVGTRVHPASMHGAYFSCASQLLRTPRAEASLQRTLQHGEPSQARMGTNSWAASFGIFFSGFFVRCFFLWIRLCLGPSTARGTFGVGLGVARDARAPSRFGFSFLPHAV